MDVISFTAFGIIIFMAMIEILIVYAWAYMLDKDNLETSIPFSMGILILVLDVWLACDFINII